MRLTAGRPSWNRHGLAVCNGQVCNDGACNGQVVWTLSRNVTVSHEITATILGDWWR